tara:strand:- start:1771 stop:2223 length:453 start_codon:yes stop_codon:yes gene_type:complete
MNQPALKYDLEWSMVHPEVLDNCWDECAKILKRSVKRSGGRVTIDDIYRDVDSGRCEMWIVYDTVSLNIIGCSITFLKEYPTGLRMLHIDHIAGIKMNWWLEDGLNMMSHFAKKNGYDGIEGIGRTGFWNWFKNMGWRKHATFFEIRLQE